MIGKKIAKLAKEKGLCRPWFKEMLTIDKIETLCLLYFRGDDWSMEKDFPPLEILREYKDQTKEFNLITDSKENFINLQRAAFFGTSKSFILFSDFTVSNLIIRHDSEIEIIAKGNSILTITLLDNAKLKIKTEDRANVVVFYDGNLENIDSEGPIKILKKEWKIQ